MRSSQSGFAPGWVWNQLTSHRLFLREFWGGLFQRKKGRVLGEATDVLNMGEARPASGPL